MSDFTSSGDCMARNILLPCMAMVFSFVPISSSAGADWPMWRYDAARTSSSPDQLPGEVHLQWVRQYSQREMVWDDPLNHDLMPYDRVFEPVVSGNTLFIGFNDTDKVIALDAATGSEKWAFYTDGPVRFSPVIYNGHVYFVSDDGCLYCVDAETGRQRWKIRGGPSDRKILGNKRFISTWPARGAPVIADGTVYFAAGIWPFMGIFIYAVDAESGEIIWTNESNGSRFMLQPHDAPSFAGVAPQGALVVEGNKLLVPGGRSVPACFDRATGEFMYYELASSGKTGGSFVCASGDLFINHYRDRITSLFDIQTGVPLLTEVGRYPVVNHRLFYFSGETITAYDTSWIKGKLEEWKEQEAAVNEVRLVARNELLENRLWEIDVDATGDLIQAGNHLYAAGNGKITAIRISDPESTPEIIWTKTIDGHVERLVAANNMLFAVTLDGRIMAFGENRKNPDHILDRPQPSEPSIEMNKQALDIIDITGVDEGYAFFYGVGNGELLESLANNSELHIIGVDPDRSKVAALRQRFDANGLYGKRISILHGDPFTIQTPPYMSSLAIVHELDTEKYPPDEILLGNMYHTLRPYGGVAFLPYTGNDQDEVEDVCHMIDREKAAVVKGKDYTLVMREGALSGAGEWTHNYGNIENTAKSDESNVKLPLGLLWFGGNSNLDVLPRHGHGPSEQIVGGRLIIEGIDCISARDVYTGRVLWKVMLHDLGNYDVYYDSSYRDTPISTSYNQEHLPGANARGTNYIATVDEVYVLAGSSCIVLDSSTGEQLRTITLPRIDPEDRRSPIPSWGYIGMYENLLIAGFGTVAFTDLLETKRDEYDAWKNFDNSASNGLVVLDRFTGEVKWRTDARHGFIHNGITAGSGRLYCLDKLPMLVEQQLRRRGKLPPESYRLLALDIHNGSVVWEEEERAFGSFLSYSGEKDMLLQSTRPSRDMLGGEDGERIIALRGTDGKVIWDEKLNYATFPILHGDNIITESGMFSLATGEPVMRINPITDTSSLWSWKRYYGCNYPIASENLLTFRSGAAGFYDLTNDGGTGNFGGFKSGCTANLIAADGVLNAPDYTRTCSCSYQNQTSLALVHMPEAEYWTFNTIESPTEQIQRIGINFGAPGDRIADNGTLWLDYPSVGGESPDIPILTVPEEPDWYRLHSSRIGSDELPWVAASGGNGLRSITLSLGETFAPAEYTVRLYFAEPEFETAGKRVFDVLLQGWPVLENFDIVKEIGNRRQTLVKEFSNITVDTELIIAFDPAVSSEGTPILSGVELIIEEE